MRIVFAGAIAVVLGCGQSGPTFEAASVRLHDPAVPLRVRMSSVGGPGTDRPEHYECRGCTLALMISKAYDIEPYQVAGPDWIEREIYELNAKVRPGATKEELGPMIQSLLAERFKLKLRRDVREVSGNEISIPPGRSKLKDAGEPIKVREEPAPPVASRLDGAGFPNLVSGETLAMNLNRYRRHTHETMKEFLHWLTIWLAKPVIDKTGLAGRYDITLSFVMKAPTAQPDDLPGPSLEDAVRDAGFRLVSKKVPVEYFIVESALRIPIE